MTTEIQQNRYDQTLRRVAGMIGPGSKVSEVLSELFPMFDVEPTAGELLLLGGYRTCFGGGTITGAAGEAPRAQLFNPADSSILITITKVQVSASTAVVMRYGRRDVQIAATIQTQIFRDFRQPVTPQPVGEVSQLSSLTQANATGQFLTAANVLNELTDANDVAVLAPNTGFEIGTNVNTSKLHYTFFWRERTAEPSELNF